MTQLTERTSSRPVDPGPVRGRFDRTDLIGYAAFLALLLYGLAHTYWAFGGDGFPFGADDANPEYSAFEHVGRDRLAPWTAGGFLGSSMVALLLALPGRRRTTSGSPAPRSPPWARSARSSRWVWCSAGARSSPGGWWA